MKPIGRPFRHLVLACVASLAPPAFAAAHEALPPAVAACRDIADDDARLACYDRATARPAAGQRVNAEDAGRLPAPEKPVEPPPPPEPQANRAAPRPADDATEPAADPDEYRAEVVGIRTKPRGELVIALDNGETWEEISPSRYFPLEPGDTVELKTGLFGSWRMVSPAGRATRVRRTE